MGACGGTARAAAVRGRDPEGGARPSGRGHEGSRTGKLPEPAWCERWCVLHALVVLSATAFVASSGRAFAGVVLLGVSLLALLGGAGRLMRPGLANGLTLARLGLVLSLPLFPDPLLTGGVALSVLVLDGVDGWLARRLGAASRIGEYLDKETDAALLVVLSWTLWLAGAPVWVLAIGLWRSLFVLALRLIPPSGGASREIRTRLGRVVFVVVSVLCASAPAVASLLAAHPAGATSVRDLLLAVALALLSASFLEALWRLYRAPVGEPGAPGSTERGQEAPYRGGRVAKEGQA